MFNINEVSGTSERGVYAQGMDQIVLDLFDYLEKMNAIFNEAEEIVEGSKKFFKDGTGDAYRKKFNSFKSNFPIFNNNVISYIDDLKQAKANVIGMTEKTAQSVDKSTSRVHDERGTRVSEW